MSERKGVWDLFNFNIDKITIYQQWVIWNSYKTSFYIFCRERIVEIKKRYNNNH